MRSNDSFAEYDSRLRGFIARSERDDNGFNQLALELFTLQFAGVESYRRLCEAGGVRLDQIRHWTEIPAVPIAAFKELELSSLPVVERTVVFHSSGTSGRRPSRHFHSADSLTLYEASLLPWFKTHLLPDANRFKFIMLTPPPDQAAQSSLVHMLTTVGREFGSAESQFTGKTDETGGWVLDPAATLSALRQSVATHRPVALVGTAFSFVHLLDHLAVAQIGFKLPAGSRVMETGGYKGRSRELPRAELHALITRHLGIPASQIVCEYGMSELSSQAYDCVAAAHASTCQPASGSTLEPFNALTLRRIFRFPPWARVQIVSPETGAEVAEGETGLIRVYDLANARSVQAIQTEDLGARRDEGFELIGRVALAEPRGCSLMNSGWQQSPPALPEA